MKADSCHFACDVAFVHMVAVYLSWHLLGIRAFIDLLFCCC